MALKMQVTLDVEEEKEDLLQELHPLLKLELIKAIKKDVTSI